MSIDAFQILTTVLSSNITTTVFLTVVAWVFKNIIEGRIARQFKELEFLASEVSQKRAEIAVDAFKFIKRCVSGDMKLGELSKTDIHDRIACWFPDDTYVLARDFFAKTAKDPSGSWVEWTHDVEPILQSLVSAIRSGSNILGKKGFLYPGMDGTFHFLPNLKCRDE